MGAPEELILSDPDYGEELALRIAASGREIRTNAGAPGEAIVGADYIRVLDAQGRELAYWSHTEWAEEPVEVLGAILGAAAGCGASRPESGSAKEP